MGGNIEKLKQEKYNAYVQEPDPIKKSSALNEFKSLVALQTYKRTQGDLMEGRTTNARSIVMEEILDLRKLDPKDPDQPRIKLEIEEKKRLGEQIKARQKIITKSFEKPHAQMAQEISVQAMRQVVGEESAMNMKVRDKLLTFTYQQGKTDLPFEVALDKDGRVKAGAEIKVASMRNISSEQRLLASEALFGKTLQDPIRTDEGVTRSSETLAVSLMRGYDQARNEILQDKFPTAKTRLMTAEIMGITPSRELQEAYRLIEKEGSLDRVGKQDFTKGTQLEGIREASEPYRKELFAKMEAGEVSSSRVLKELLGLTDDTVLKKKPWWQKFRFGRGRAQGYVPNFIPKEVAAEERRGAFAHGYTPGAVMPYNLKGKDSGMTPSEFIKKEGIAKSGGFVPNFKGAVINKNEILMTKKGSSAEAVIPPNDFSKIDMEAAAEKGYQFKKASGGVIPVFNKRVNENKDIINTERNRKFNTERNNKLANKKEFSRDAKFTTSRTDEKQQIRRRITEDIYLGGGGIPRFEASSSKSSLVQEKMINSSSQTALSDSYDPAGSMMNKGKIPSFASSPIKF